MRAAVITAAGGPDVLDVREVPDPEPRAGELLVRVRASALNRADLAQRRGLYPAPPGSPADIPGIEYAGEVAALGEGVRGFTPGERVFGIAGGGAHAELLRVPASSVVRMPSPLDWTDAGAVPEAFMTAHDAMRTQGALGAGEAVLIHAVGSGVGLAAVQVARAVGAVPYGTTRTADKLVRARAMGMEDGTLADDPAALAERVREWRPGGVQMVLDLVGGAWTPASTLALAPRGRLLLVGLVAGSTATFDLRAILSRRLTLIGTVLRARSEAEKAAVAEAFTREVIPWLAAGTVRPVVDAVFPLDEIADAHRLLEGNETFGKVVLTI
jgi:NADPH2:quinone reductase